MWKGFRCRGWSWVAVEPGNDFSIVLFSMVLLMMMGGEVAA